MEEFNTLSQLNDVCSCASNGNNSNVKVQRLRISSFNSTGFGHSKQVNIQSMCDNYDIVIIQEYWLLHNQLHKVVNCAKGYFSIAVLGVDACTSILPGRPSGGCAILWRRYLDVIIKPVEILFMCNHLYICSNRFWRDLAVILTDISSVCAHVKPDGILIGGDINYDFNRNSGFVNTVSEYMIDNNLHSIWDAYLIDYTYNSSQQGKHIYY